MSTLSKRFYEAGTLLPLEGNGPYLWHLDNCKNQINEFIQNAHAMVLNGKELGKTEFSKLVWALINEMQTRFYGQDRKNFTTNPNWNRPEYLGKYIVETCGAGGDPDDAVRRLFNWLFDETIAHAQTFETNPNWEKEIFAAAELVWHCLMGLDLDMGKATERAPRLPHELVF